MKLKSHTREQILAAFNEGEKVFALDTLNSGNDDVLIGEEHEIVSDLTVYHGIEGMPEGWELRQITQEEFENRFGQGDCTE